MMNMKNDIKVICKRCKKSSSAEGFILDPVYKMMVCPTCVAERRSKLSSAQIKGAHGGNAEAGTAAQKGLGAAVSALTSATAGTAAPAKPAKPKGWDSEDEFLDRTLKQKQDSGTGANIEYIDGNRVKYTCNKCKYKFVYDTVRKHPNTCPYCCMPVTLNQPKY